MHISIIKSLVSISQRKEVDTAIFERNLTLRDNLKCVSLRNLKDSIEEKTLVMAVLFIVMRASKINAIYKDIEDGVAMQLTIDLLEIFDFDAFQDIVLMFKYARQGKLKINDFAKKKSFSETVLNDFTPAYLEFKAQEREQLRLELKESEVHHGTWSKKSLEHLKTLRNSLKSESKNVKLDGILGTQSAYKEQLTELVKSLSEKDLKELIKTWSVDFSKKYYVSIFENELKSRKSE